MLNVTFDHGMKDADARSAMQRIASAGGWSATGIEIETERGQGARASQTGVTGILSGPPVYSGGGFLIRPFVVGLSGYDRVDLLYMTQRLEDFRGLWSYDSPAVHVGLISAGAPYRYAVLVLDHDGPVPDLPVTQDPPARSTTALPPGADARSSGRQIAVVLLVASLSGALVFSGLLWRARTRVGRASPGSGTVRVNLAGSAKARSKERTR